MAVKHLWILIIGLFYLIGFAAPATARLQVVTTTEDLASLTHEVGGDKVEVNAIAKGYQERKGPLKIHIDSAEHPRFWASWETLN